MKQQAVPPRQHEPTRIGESSAEVVARAERASQRLRLAAPLRLGLDPAADAAALRLLTVTINRFWSGWLDRWEGPRSVEDVA